MKILPNSLVNYSWVQTDRSQGSDLFYMVKNIQILNSDPHPPTVTTKITEFVRQPVCTLRPVVPVDQQSFLQAAPKPVCEGAAGQPLSMPLISRTTPSSFIKASAEFLNETQKKSSLEVNEPIFLPPVGSLEQQRTGEVASDWLPMTSCPTTMCGRRVR
jgi:hypothetical protein